MTKRFTDANEGFTCVHCGEKVSPSTRSCRNHCPHCFYSVHVDVHPGDRANPCRGVMKPIAVVTNTKKGFQVVHQCLSCGSITRNILRFDDDSQPDSLDKALELMSKAP